MLVLATFPIVSPTTSGVDGAPMTPEKWVHFENHQCAAASVDLLVLARDLI